MNGLPDTAGWIAPVATMIAAMMTAANMGARFTGYGFVVFLAGSVCWAVVGGATGQTNLLATNIFLCMVNGVGIWRWLGRQRVYEEGGRAAEIASRHTAAPDLLAATGLAGTEVISDDGAAVGKAVEALLDCATGVISYVVIAEGGVAGVKETLRAVPNECVIFGAKRWSLRLSADVFSRLPEIEGSSWPASAPRSPAAFGESTRSVVSGRN